MISILNNISFANPLALWAIGSLPLIYLVVKTFPPAPKSFNFSSLYLLKSISSDTITRSKCPIWLLIFRILLILVIIIYFSKPFINSSKLDNKIENYFVFLDAGWSTASEWENYKDTLLEIMLEAKKLNKKFYLLRSNPDKERDSTIMFQSTNQLSDYLNEQPPSPWQFNLDKTINKLDKTKFKKNTRYFYILSDFDYYPNEKRISSIIKEKYPNIEIINLVSRIKVLDKPSIIADNIEIKVKRLGNFFSEDQFYLKMVSKDGQVIYYKNYNFKKNDHTVIIREKFPLSLINRLEKIEIVDQNHAAGKFYFDDLNKKKIIGIVSEIIDYKENPLLSSVYYIKKALGNENKIIINNLENLISANIDILILPDVGLIEEKLSIILKKWISNGGLLIRFSGPKLAKEYTNFITTEKTYKKIRFLGGQLSWEDEPIIESFPDNSIFRGLEIPDDIVIRKQLMLDFKGNQKYTVLGSLKDGTPLITSKEYDKGKIILFHFTANNDWSNIPITNLFVEMLYRTTLFNSIRKNDSLEEVKMKYFIDGFGKIQKPDKIIKIKDGIKLQKSHPSPKNIPGIYENDELSIALNLSGNLKYDQFVKESYKNTTEEVFFKKSISDLSKIFLYLIIIFSIVDIIATLMIKINSNILKTFKKKIGYLSMFFLLFCFIKNDNLKANDYFNETYLAYVKSANENKNKITKRGLNTLSEVLDRRTSISPRGVIEVDIEKDEIFYFPFLYWPIGKTLPDLSARTITKVKDYLFKGGIIFFDAYEIKINNSSDSKNLKKMVSFLRKINSNELINIDKKHTLSKSFYLLNSFPGRWNKNLILTDKNDKRINDGVSSIVLGFNDWASAWALDENNYPIYPVVPGGEKQREFAYRVGVNITMYSLTGTYKNDQIHSKSILERLKRY